MAADMEVNIIVVIQFSLGLLLSYYIIKGFYRPGTDDVPTILWWTPFMPPGDRYIHCQNHHECLVTSNRSLNFEIVKAMLFYGSHFDPQTDLPPWTRSNSVLSGLYHEESPKNFPGLLDPEVQSLFNVTATFSRYSDFPLTLHYLPDISALLDKTFYRDVQHKNGLLDDRSPVVYLQSSCDTFSSRDELVSELMSHVNIDSFGQCLNNRQLPQKLSEIDPLDLYNPLLLEFIGQYKFVIAFENALCEDYITEKLWRSLQVGVVPIYLGSPSVEDWLPNEKSAVLVKDFKDMRSVAEHIKLVNQNDTLYNSYLVHKTEGRINNLRLEELSSNRQGHDVLNFECFVCNKLHETLEVSSEIQKENVFNCKPPGRNSPWI